MATSFDWWMTGGSEAGVSEPALKICDYCYWTRLDEVGEFEQVLLSEGFSITVCEQCREVCDVCGAWKLCEELCSKCEPEEDDSDELH